jgi:hypothetical protein
MNTKDNLPAKPEQLLRIIEYSTTSRRPAIKASRIKSQGKGLAEGANPKKIHQKTAQGLHPQRIVPSINYCQIAFLQQAEIA